MYLIVKNKETGKKYTAMEFNEQNHVEFIKAITQKRQVIETARIGNIFKFAWEDSDNLDVFTLVYGDVLLYDKNYNPMMVVTEYHIWRQYDDVTMEEALDLAHQVFTPEGVSGIMHEPQTMWNGKTGYEYAAEHGWYAILSQMASLYEGGIV